MRSYKGTEIKVGDPGGPRMTFTVMMWREGNHGTVFSDNECIYDGPAFNCGKVIDTEVQRLVGWVEKYGFKYELVERRG